MRRSSQEWTERFVDRWIGPAGAPAEFSADGRDRARRLRTAVDPVSRGAGVPPRASSRARRSRPVPGRAPRSPGPRGDAGRRPVIAGMRDPGDARRPSTADSSRTGTPPVTRTRRGGGGLRRGIRPPAGGPAIELEDLRHRPADDRGPLRLPHPHPDRRIEAGEAPAEAAGRRSAEAPFAFLPRPGGGPGRRPPAGLADGPVATPAGPRGGPGADDRRGPRRRPAASPLPAGRARRRRQPGSAAGGGGFRHRRDRAPAIRRGGGRGCFRRRGSVREVSGRREGRRRPGMRPWRRAGGAITCGHHEAGARLVRRGSGARRSPRPCPKGRPRQPAPR